MGITIRQEELQDAGTFFTNVGYDSQKIHLYTATGGTEGEQHLDPSEEIDILRIPFEKAMEMVKSRKIREVKTAYLLQREQWQRR